MLLALLGKSHENGHPTTPWPPIEMRRPEAFMNSENISCHPVADFIFGISPMDASSGS